MPYICNFIFRMSDLLIRGRFHNNKDGSSFGDFFTLMPANLNL